MVELSHRERPPAPPDTLRIHLCSTVHPPVRPEPARPVGQRVFGGTGSGHSGGGGEHRREASRLRSDVGLLGIGRADARLPCDGLDGNAAYRLAEGRLTAGDRLGLNRRSRSTRTTPRPSVCQMPRMRNSRHSRHEGRHISCGLGRLQPI